MLQIVYCTLFFSLVLVFSFSWFSIFAISTFTCSAGGLRTSQYPKIPSERVRPLRPSVDGMVDTASTSFSLMRWFHIYFCRHARRGTTGSENPARAVEASVALVRRALIEDLRDHYMINRRQEPTEVINLSHSIGSFVQHRISLATFLRLNVLSQIAGVSVRSQAGRIT